MKVGIDVSMVEFLNAEQLPVSPTIKHLFGGFDVTIFAYGSTGTGKTHTMRGGKSLAERGIIPRLLSRIYRRIQKDSSLKKTMALALSYYEIYNDKVYDLFEPPEKRSAAGLPLRDNGGKTTVVGLTERPCESLKEFEKLYDQANINRSTSATKLNAHSSRSHAILRISLTITTEDEERRSTLSAIDLAGSEDNRRTENGKERLVESASINKSLFVLAKCVEAISQKQERIPYRESKMTRILSLGQNNGMTVMFLNLAPVKSFHLDTLSSLNFANRTKRIEVREIENEPVFKTCPRVMPTMTGPSIQRQPLRPLAVATHNASANTAKDGSKQSDKPSKAFSVFSDRARQTNVSTQCSTSARETLRLSSPTKRHSEAPAAIRPAKRRSPLSASRPPLVMSKAAIEDMIEKKVGDILAARALDQPSTGPVPEISQEVQRRLEMLEQKIDCQDDSREQGLTFLLMAKQHAVRGEDASALRMFKLARDHFPENEKLALKIERLQSKLEQRVREETTQTKRFDRDPLVQQPLLGTIREQESKPWKGAEDDYELPAATLSADEGGSDDSFHYKPKSRKPKGQQYKSSLKSLGGDLPTQMQTPRTKQLLDVVNSRDISQIRLLKGVGAKKAEMILEALCGGEDDDARIYSLRELARMKGVGARTVENMRIGLG